MCINVYVNTGTAIKVTSDRPYVMINWKGKAIV